MRILHKFSRTIYISKLLDIIKRIRCGKDQVVHKLNKRQIEYSKNFIKDEADSQMV